MWLVIFPSGGRDGNGFPKEKNLGDPKMMPKIEKILLGEGVGWLCETCFWCGAPKNVQQRCEICVCVLPLPYPAPLGAGTVVGFASLWVIRRTFKNVAGYFPPPTLANFPVREGGK